MLRQNDKQTTVIDYYSNWRRQCEERYRFCHCQNRFRS